jgi:hypothetical protein
MWPGTNHPEYLNGKDAIYAEIFIDIRHHGDLDTHCL